MVFRLVKKVYEHRSNIVHGRSARRDQIKVGKRRSALRTWVSTSCGRSLWIACSRRRRGRPKRSTPESWRR